MAKYAGVFLCGHKGLVDIIGPHADRKRKIEEAFGHNCPECRMRIQKKELEQAKKDLAFKVHEYEFPELTGTRSQIEWANSIRIKFYDKFKDHRIAYDMIQNETKASFWLDSEYWLFTEKFLNKYHKQQKSKIKHQMIIDMDTITPEELKYDGAVEIVKDLHRICLFYLKEDDFIALAKKYLFKWDPDDLCWYRVITEFTGDFANLAAKIGNALLRNGFAICIHDEQIKERAINAEYEKEFYRWVLWDVQNRALALHWTLKNNESYEASRKIRDNSYDTKTGHVLIPIARYRSVNNFASKYNFHFSQEALEAIEQYKTEVRALRKVKAKEKNNK